MSTAIGAVDGVGNAIFHGDDWLRRLDGFRHFHRLDRLERFSRLDRLRGLGRFEGLDRLDRLPVLDGVHDHRRHHARILGHHGHARLDAALTNRREKVNLHDLRLWHALRDRAKKPLLRFRHRTAAAARGEPTDMSWLSSSRSTNSRRMCMKS
jgi:hypothetical protein